jgi:thiol-disulfide isomerase/thioredoxin
MLGVRAHVTLGIHLILATLCNGLLTSCARAPSDPQHNLNVVQTSIREVSGTKLLLPMALWPSDQKAVVMLFLAPDCPISNAYAPEIGRLIDVYGPRGVTFRVVHSDRRVTADAARQHARDFNLRCDVLLDPEHELADAAGATVTPEAAVFAEGKRVYLGRIDDLFYSFGKRRAAPTTRELRDALDAVLAGQPVARAAVPALGCEIPPP